MAVTTTIGSRFNGPPTSANGGYACGVAAGLLGEPATVTLIAPPPLDVDVTLEQTDDGFRVTGPSGPWAAVQPREVGIDTIDPVALEEAVMAAERFDGAAYRDIHVFPTCFTCGPDRTTTDGLRIFPGQHPVRDGIVTWPWTPQAEHADHDAHVGDEILWAALDCPSGLAWRNEARTTWFLLTDEQAAAFGQSDEV